ncbi:YraN family protein [Albidovulum sp.]|uniref:YraN family protein n=1 Tax=Albidovulum sp. TaxID=1872424 RepID=UPI003D7D8E4A
MAEEQVEAVYLRSGLTVAARRWRGAAGEIDLILRDGAQLVFVEVKRAETHAIAADRVSDRQRQRILAAASEFVATEPGGQDSEMRFDVALVDGQGRIEIVGNALGP